MAQRQAEAKKAAQVWVEPAADGMASLGADLPAEEAAEAYDLIDTLARMAKADGDERPIGAIRAEVFSLLLRRPAGHGLPTPQAKVTVTAALESLEGSSTAPGEVNGFVITIGQLRNLLARVGALGLDTPPDGSLTFAVTDPDGRLLATLTPAELARLAARGCPAHPDGQCGCPVAGLPEDSPGYTPTAGQRRAVTCRDRRCRMPNCGQRAGWADLDHVLAHADGGPTSCSNLCCLCRSHHRLKTFAPGWTFRMDPDGTLHVTSPAGITRTTRPPGLRTRTPAPQPPQPAPDPPPF
jgi:hypothetical protein